MPAKRIAFLDYVRVIACFMVMLVHACEQYYCSPGPDPSNPGWFTFVAGSEERLWVALYDGLCRVSVPLFMIVSAFLLVPLKDGTDMVQFYRKRAARILPPFIIFLVLYSVLPWLFGWADSGYAMGSLARIPFNFPDFAGHLWFMYPLIGLYLFLPMVSPWLAKVPARDERIFLGLFFVSTCIPYLNRLVGDLWGKCLWNGFDALWYFSGFLGYVVLAHYIRVHLDWSRSRRLWVGIAATVAGAIPTVLSFWYSVTPGVFVYTGDAEIGWAFCLPNVLVMTAGVFLLFTCMRREDVPARVVSLSQMSYGMYLMHVLWLMFWAPFVKGQLPVAFAIPVMAVLTFVSSYVSCLVIASLPGGRWVVGATANVKSGYLNSLGTNSVR